MGRAACVPCVLCARMGLGDSPSIVHHMKLGTGASDRASDYQTIAVCPAHHVGPDGIHVLKEHGLRSRYNCSEIDLLADTLAAMEGLK